MDVGRLMLQLYGVLFAHSYNSPRTIIHSNGASKSLEDLRLYIIEILKSDMSRSRTNFRD